MFTLSYILVKKAYVCQLKGREKMNKEVLVFQTSKSCFKSFSVFKISKNLPHLNNILEIMMSFCNNSFS